MLPKWGSSCQNLSTRTETNLLRYLTGENYTVSYAYFTRWKNSETWGPGGYDGPGTVCVLFCVGRRDCTGACRPGQTMEMNTVTVYDIQNKFIAYSAPFPAVIGVFCEWGSLYVLAGDRKVRDSDSVFQLAPCRTMSATVCCRFPPTFECGS